jgi:hypothetical protein
MYPFAVNSNFFMGYPSSDRGFLGCIPRMREAKDDATDAEFALETLLRHPEQFSALKLERPAMRSLRKLVQARRDFALAEPSGGKASSPRNHRKFLSNSQRETSRHDREEDREHQNRTPSDLGQGHH